MENVTHFCNVCGWASEGRACEVYGSLPDEVPETRDHENLSLLAGPQPESYPHLRPAFVAWRQKDWTRMVGQCLNVLEVEALTVTRLDAGPCWTFVQDSAAVYMHIDENTAVMSLESPVVWMPATQGIPLMRALLELNAYALGSSRFCLRGDRVVLRFEDTLANLNPPKLIDAICEVAVLADDYDDQLSSMFAARMIGPVAQAEGLDWKFLGRPRRLTFPTPATSPPPPSLIRTPNPAPASPPTPRNGTVTKVGIEERLLAAEDLCDLLRESQQINLALGFKADGGEIHSVMVQRALLFRVYREFSETCPGAVAQIMAKAGRVASSLFQAADGRPLGAMSLDLDENAELAMPAALAMAETCDSLLAMGGHSDFGDPPGLEPFASRLDAVRHFRGAMAAVEDGPEDGAFAHFVLLGMLAEIILRAPLPPRLDDVADRALRLASGRGPEPDQTRQLRELLERLIA